MYHHPAVVTQSTHLICSLLYKNKKIKFNKTPEIDDKNNNRVEPFSAR